jgi:hypothetical protein
VRETTTVDAETGGVCCSANSDRLAQRIAQIVREFLNAYGLARRIGRELRAGTLEFAMVDRFAGDSPRSVLFRLKENCHALFREPASAPRNELRAAELFDLAVGALFHEAAKFRESYYLYTSYGPRARRSLEESPSGPLSSGFRRLFEAGYRRMLESEAQTEELFRETREQLRVLLRDWSHSGEIARSLVADPEQTEKVFGVPVADLLTELFGSTSRAYLLAIGCLVESGHYSAAAALLELPGVVKADLQGVEFDLVRGLAAYYEGDPCRALRLLGGWARNSGAGLPALRGRARAVLRLIAYEVEEPHPALAEEARRLEETVIRLNGG